MVKYETYIEHFNQDCFDLLKAIIDNRKTIEENRYPFVCDGVEVTDECIDCPLYLFFNGTISNGGSNKCPFANFIEECNDELYGLAEYLIKKHGAIYILDKVKEKMNDV